MSRNPYEAPRSEVRDRKPERVLETRPRQFLVAMGLIWFTWLLAFPALYFEFRRNAPGFEPGTEGVIMIWGALVMGAAAALNVFLGLGRNWARVVYLAMTLITAASTLAQFEELAGHTALENLMEAVAWTAEVAALYLLFTKPAALWFQYRD